MKSYVPRTNTAVLAQQLTCTKTTIHLLMGSLAQQKRKPIFTKHKKKEKHVSAPLFFLCGTLPTTPECGVVVKEL